MITLSIQGELFNILLDNHKNGNEWLEWHKLCELYDHSYRGRKKDQQVDTLKTLKSTISRVDQMLRRKGMMLSRYREMNSRGNYHVVTAIRIFQKGDEKWIAAHLQKKRNMAEAYQKSFDLELKAVEEHPAIEFKGVNLELKQLALGYKN